MNEQIDRKLAQQIVDTVKDVCGQNVNFIDGSGLIYASTDAGRIGSYHEIGRQAAVAGKAIEAVSYTHLNKAIQNYVTCNYLGCAILLPILNLHFDSGIPIFLDGCQASFEWKAEV